MDGDVNFKMNTLHVRSLHLWIMLHTRNEKVKLTLLSLHKLFYDFISALANNEFSNFKMLVSHSDLRSITRTATGLCYMNRPRRPGIVRARVSYGVVSEKEKKASICTGDELHYVSVPNSDWRLALWRYLPCAESVKRNHPLLLLSGVATNAVGYDLSPQVSFLFISV
jgi:hypothetical protein